jgi:hypothetical protein
MPAMVFFSFGGAFFLLRHDLTASSSRSFCSS